MERVCYVTWCIPLSCKNGSDRGRNTPYGVSVVEASISSKSSGPLRLKHADG